MSNHYETLGIHQSAEPQDIKKAYFDLAKKYHPDSGDETEVRKFHEITQAYKTLSDKDLKKAYDLTLNAGLEVIKAKEAEVAAVSPVYPTTHVNKREVFRDVELKDFHRNRFKKAILRVVVFTLVFSGLGALMAMVLSGRWYAGALAGLLIGLSISLRKNFDIHTFFESKKRQEFFHIFLWLILFSGVAYFFVLVGGFVVK